MISWWVYPRVCGGTEPINPVTTVTRGLSPRVRGNRGSQSDGRNSGRSIPACAGEPGLRRYRFLATSVYPRVCGGTHCGAGGFPRRRGLSPRVRGNPGSEEGKGLRHGSIPACAGEPAARPAGWGQCGVYPRVCGGTRRSCASSGPLPGLSPRVRGNPRTPRNSRTSRRSIPACAGEPPWDGSALSLSGVYPRVCGGTVVASTDTETLTGLSPRVRGNPRHRLSPASSARSIPACAGEPPCPIILSIATSNRVPEAV